MGTATKTLAQEPSRRAILGALVTAPIAAASCAPAIAAAASSSGMSPAVAAAVAALHAARRAEDDFDREIFRPVYDVWDIERGKVPHVEVGTDPYSGCESPVTTEDWRAVHGARRLVRDVAAGKCYLETDRYPSLARHWEFSQRLAAAADERDAVIDALSARYGIDELEARSMELGEVHSAAFMALVAVPAETVGDLHAKMVEISIHETWDWEDVQEVLLADADRVAAAA